jgi:hypothetical protein
MRQQEARAYQEQHCQLQQAEHAAANDKAAAMLAYQNAQFAAACLAQMNKAHGRCEGCGQ